MTSSISDFILNNVQAAKDPAKASQYMTKENDRSFDLIFDNINQISSSAQKADKTSDKGFVPYNSNENKQVIKQNEQNDKKNEYVFEKTSNTVKTKSSHVDNSVKEKQNEKDFNDLNKSDDLKREDIEAKTKDPKKTETKDATELQIKQEVGNDDSVGKKAVSPDEQNEQNEQSDVKDQSDNQSQNSSNPNASTDKESDLTAVTQSEIIDENALNLVQESNAVISSMTGSAVPVQAEQSVVSEYSEPVVETDSSGKSQIYLDKKVETAGANSENVANLTQEEISETTASEVAQPEMLDSEQSTDGSVAEVQVKAADDVAVKNDKVNQNDNIAIDQTVLTEMDAEVVDNGSSGNSFARQQNAAEQVVKLSIAPMSKSEGPDFSHLMNQNKLQFGQEKIQTNIAQTPAKELSKFDILNQIAEKMPNLKTGTDKVEIILKPENLGKVNVELQSSRGMVSATLIAESKQVKELLEKNIDTLRNNLTSQGVNVNSVVVKVEEPAKAAFNSFDFSQGQFGSEAQRQQQDSQKANNLGNAGDIAGQNTLGEAEEGAVSTAEFRDSKSLHDGMVDYKV